MILVYLAGFLSFPVLTTAATGVWWATRRSAVLAYESTCLHCSDLGWSHHLPARHTHRLRITQWLYDQWHYLFMAQRKPHRELWQRYYEEHPNWVYSPGSWRKFGLRPIKRETDDE